MEQNNQNRIRAIILEPDKKARIEEISTSLESLQEIVQGSIERVGISDDASMIVNEEGKLFGDLYNQFTKQVASKRFTISE